MSTLALTTIFAVGAALRLHACEFGVSTEEVALVEHDNLIWFVLGSESGINPPLYPVVMNSLFSVENVLFAGRYVSVLSGLASVLITYRLTRLLEAGRLASLGAALFIAIHPTAVQIGAEYRSYGPFLFLELAALWAISEWTLRPPGVRRTVTAGIATATLAAIPQIHYIGVPLVVALFSFVILKRNTRRLAWAFIPGIICITPLLLLVFRTAEARHPTDHGSRDALIAMLSLDLSVPGAFASNIIRYLGLSLNIRDVERLCVASPIIVFACFKVSNWRGLSPIGQLLVVASGAVLTTAAIFSAFQQVRTPTVVMFLAPFVPLAFGARARLVGNNPKSLPNLLIVTILSFAVTDRISRGTAPESRNAMQNFAKNWTRFDDVRHGRTFYLYPKVSHTVLHYYFVGRPWGPVAPATACGDSNDCFAYEGATFRSVSSWRERPADGIFVSFDLPQSDFGEGCELLTKDPAAIWDCHPPDRN